MMGVERSDGTLGAGLPTIIVYWRPGCPYCARLLWGLRRMNVATELRNIWADSDAASFVRSVNGGNETVPTVVIAGTTLVNPTVRQIKKELDKYPSHHDEI